MIDEEREILIKVFTEATKAATIERLKRGELMIQAEPHESIIVDFESPSGSRHHSFFTGELAQSMDMVQRILKALPGWKLLTKLPDDPGSFPR